MRSWNIGDFKALGRYLDESKEVQMSCPQIPLPRLTTNEVEEHM
jgi:hypothetical protein